MILILILTIHIPTDELLKKLAGDGMTLEHFKGELTCAMKEDMNAEDLCPGATATIEIKD